MEQSFCFVDGMHNDRSTRKRMRRHVMLGKNAGKTIQRRSRMEKLRCQVVKAPSSCPPIEDREMQRNPQAKFGLDFYTPDMIYNNVLAGLSFPVKLSPHFAEVISTFFIFVAHRLYPVALGISMDKSKYTWMTILMSDKAAFFCNIALMQACNELFLGEGEESPVAMYYLSNSLAHVRERLESAEALSDSTIGIVMSLITQEQCRHQYEAAKIHMDGLAQMIELRGGLQSLESCLPVLLKACKTDLMFTLEREDPPHFHRDCLPQVRSTLSRMGLPFNAEIARKCVQHPDLDPALKAILVDVICTSTLFNDIASTQKVDLYLFQELLISICYRLLAVPHTNSPPKIENAYHVGLTLFMMILFLQIGHQRVMNYNNVTRRLRRVLESGVLDGEDDLKFWLLMIGGVWVSDDDDAEWLVPMLEAQVKKMHLQSWSRAKEAVERWSWIGPLHDGPGRVVWERACRG